MYIDNPKKLFKDLSKITTISVYMMDLLQADKQDDLIEMINIVQINKDELCDSSAEGGESNTLWDLAEYENAQERARVRKDSRVLKKIWDIIVKELNSMNIKID